MNVNLSNVSATNKVSVTDSSSKVAEDNPESKGFFETLAGVFSDSQKAEKAVAKSDAPDASVETKDEVVNDASADSEAESQAKVSAEGGEADKVASTESTDELLEQSESKAAGAQNGDHESKSIKAELDTASRSTSPDSSEMTKGAEATTTGSESASLAAKPTQDSQTNIAQTKSSEQPQTEQVKSAMGEGQQLLGRIEQANQTLQSNELSVDSGKALPPESVMVSAGASNMQSARLTSEQQNALATDTSIKGMETTSSVDPEKVMLDADGKPLVVASNASNVQHVPNVSQQQQGGDIPSAAQIDWNSPSTQAVHAEAMVNATTQAAVNGQVVAQGAQALVGTEALNQAIPLESEAVEVQRVALAELDIIDTKLAQGEPLSAKEIEIIEGLKSGELVADIPEQELAQFVALPSDVKVAMAEHQATLNQSRVAASAVSAQQAHQLAAQDLKHAVTQANVQTTVTSNADKAAAMAAMPDALVAANMIPAAHAGANLDLSKKAMSASLAAGAQKGTSHQQDKPEAQHGLAGQIQAAAGQQGVTAQQQARVDAAQQAQLPLQLTKELANEQVAEKVQMMMSKNLKNLDIRLDPPELGRMQIRMTMNNDLANVHFTVSNPQARDLIEQTLPRLREMLAQQGMQLADSSVQQQSSGQQQGYTASEQSGKGGSERGFSGQSDENFDADVNLDLNVTSKRDGISFYA
ncbi:flagellar hook-length control protein FliK [Vibrio rotiferianus]|uniref:flagellar hook-length control protein FliK n=1 Tax=Vibrio rotiferianus TaxID=190895 RepID=UPI0011100F57|nr:flagellar hook-length control protein FliK [Vibrio rotiferianus]TMX33184.1 flagellar hook-length control protein FliK [Vibrio rotiferianus]TMX52965.1 flagellar hook-length control protein FliK [Vibrio rotiferianus]